MAGNEIDTLIVRLAADTAGLRDEMKKANDAVAKAMVDSQKRFETAKKAAEGLAETIKTALGGALAGLSVRKLADMARSTGDWAQQLENTARSLGVTTDAVQEFDYAANKLGVDTGALRNGIADLVVKFQEAKNGSDEMRSVFSQLFAGENLNNIKTTDQLLAKLAVSLKQFSSADQLTIAKKLAGKNGEELLTVIQQLQQLRTEAHDVGAVADRELVASWARFSRELSTVTQQIDTALKSALLAIEPIILAVARGIRDIATFIGEIPNAIRGIRIEEFNRLYEKVEELKVGVLEATDAFERMPTAWNQRQLDKIKKQLEEATALFEDSKKSLNRVNVNPEPPKKDDPPTRSFTDPGKAKQLTDMLHQANAELAVMRAELSGGKLAGEWEKIHQSLVKIGATEPTIKKFKDIFDSTKAAQFQLNLKGINLETEKQQKILEALVAGNKDLIPLIEEQYRLKAQGVNLSATELEQLKGTIDAQTAINKALERQRGQTEALERTFDNLASTWQSAFVDSIFDSANAWDIWKKAGLNALKAIINEMLTLALINPLKNGLTGQNNPTLDLSKLFGSLFGSGTVSGYDYGMSAGMGAMAFAEGGPVIGGKPIIVGEKGPELWVPPGAGQIVSNDNMRAVATGGGSETPVQVIINNYSDEKASASERRGSNGMRQIEVMVGNAMAKDVRTGGPGSRAFDAAYGLKRSGTTR